MKIKEVKVTTKDLAEHFGVSEKYISQLVLDHGMPKIKHNTFDLIECLKWWWKYRERIQEEEKRKIREDQNSRARKEKAEAELKEIELEEKKKSLIPISELNHILMTAARIFKKGLESFETKLPPILKNLTAEEEIQNIIKIETNSIRKQIADVFSNTISTDKNDS